MKYAVIESDRIVSYISLSDNNRLKIEARPFCQLKLQREIAAFYNYITSFCSVPSELYEDKSDITEIQMNLIKYFINYYHSLVKQVASTEDNPDAMLVIRQFQKELRKDRNVITRFYLEGNEEYIYDKIRFNIMHHGLSYKSLVKTEILLQAKDALLYSDLWSEDENLIKAHKFEYFGEL